MSNVLTTCSTSISTYLPFIADTASNMRLVRKDINTRDGDGTVTLLPLEPEDMVGYIVLASQNSLRLMSNP